MPQSARLTEGGVQSLFGQCPFEPGDIFGGASLSVHVCVYAACAMCMCVSSFTWWSEVPTKAHMASDGWSADRQRHKECEFISVALTELIVMGH